MSWWNRLFAEPSQPKLSAEEIVKQAETIVRAYSHLVAESESTLPETALPDSKEVIRKSLLLWAALENEPETRERLCVLYMTLEDFLPPDDWKIVHEWNRIIKTKDMVSLAKGVSGIGETAVRLMKETTERATHRMQEFKELVRQADERRKERPEGPRAAPPAPAVQYDFYLREDGLLWPHTADADAWVTATNGFPRYAKGVVIPPAERDRIVQVLRADGFTVGVG